MKISKKDSSTSDMDYETARKQASEYAMALDLLAKITHSGTEREAVENIMEFFTTLFSPRKVSYVTLRDGKPEQLYSSPLAMEDDAEIKKRLARLTPKYAWTESGKGFAVKINHRGDPLGVLEVDEVGFPEYKQHYLNLTLSIVDVCGLTIENSRKYQQLKENESRLKQEKERVEAALAKVKKLSGLLPICSHCKKIRDDKGYWNQIEIYIREHSEAEFTHGICRECAKQHYPEIDIYGDGSNLHSR